MSDIHFPGSPRAHLPAFEFITNDGPPGLGGRLRRIGKAFARALPKIIEIEKAGTAIERAAIDAARLEMAPPGITGTEQAVPEAMAIDAPEIGPAEPTAAPIEMLDIPMPEIVPDGTPQLEAKKASRPRLRTACGRVCCAAAVRQGTPSAAVHGPCCGPSAGSAGLCSGPPCGSGAHWGVQPR
ncbi:MAG: hypothetical protein JWL62_2230, partial [Hyphomicrobiales bacterium]|nr:hypothetical protein [Hyphomicrobiales bacterium]